MTADFRTSNEWPSRVQAADPSPIANAWNAGDLLLRRRCRPKMPVSIQRTGTLRFTSPETLQTHAPDRQCSLVAARVAVDRDLVWFIEDWRLEDQGRIASGFGNRMEAGMSGRIGNTVTLNGLVPKAVTVKAGERVRLRLVNAALARIIGLRFEGHKPIVVAHDGQPCEPHSPEGGRVVLGPAMRADLIIDMAGKPGQSYRDIDDFYQDLAYKLVDLAYDAGQPAREP
jgi:FtsP/CotA-like multicopper oxidase with cupredoxin domain